MKWHDTHCAFVQTKLTLPAPKWQLRTSPAVLYRDHTSEIPLYNPKGKFIILTTVQTAHYVHHERTALGLQPVTQKQPAELAVQLPTGSLNNPQSTEVQCSENMHCYLWLFW